MVRRIAFVSGLILGSGLSAFALGAALIYLFTGKAIAFVSSKERGLEVRLVDLADELQLDALRETSGRAA
ncbi:MAG: hypothetical protein JW934_17715 [Anaerolineae bacterium]|nr:hypothetical protein [Anaerolineae bacterium]